MRINQDIPEAQAQTDLKPELKVDQGFADDKVSEDTQNNVGKLVSRNCWLREGWNQMKFEVTLPDKYMGIEVTSVFIHLGFEDYKPMTMLLKNDMTLEEEDEDSEELESAERIAEQQQIAKAAGSNFLAKVSGGLDQNSKVPSQLNARRSTLKIKRKTFYLWRMVPPKPEGHQYFYSLMNPKNFRKETFINQVQQRVFVE